MLPCVGEAVGNTAEAVSSENSRAGAEALILLCSTATDGRVVFWHLNPFISGWMQSRTLPVTTDVQLRTTQCTETTVGATDSSTSPVRSEGIPLCVLKLHQSGVNDIAVTTVGKQIKQTLHHGDNSCAFSVSGFFKIRAKGHNQYHS